MKHAPGIVVSWRTAASDSTHCLSFGLTAHLHRDSKLPRIQVLKGGDLELSMSTGKTVRCYKCDDDHELREPHRFDRSELVQALTVWQTKDKISRSFKALGSDKGSKNRTLSRRTLSFRGKRVAPDEAGAPPTARCMHGHEALISEVRWDYVLLVIRPKCGVVGWVRRCCGLTSLLAHCRFSAGTTTLPTSRALAAWCVGRPFRMPLTPGT